MADELDPGTSDADADGSEDRLEDLPGRPIGPDELDPELIALPRTKARIGLVLSLSVVIFCGYIMARLYGDLRFSRQPATPHELTTMNAAVDPDNTDRFVEFRAVPDRAFAVRVARSKADPGSRLIPVQGSNGKLWLLMTGNVWVAGIRYDEIYQGRLRKLARLPFFDAVGRHVRSRGPEPRFVTADAARRALSEGTTTVADPAGDAITVAPDTAVRVYEEKADEVHIRAFTTDKLASDEAWTEALVAAGLLRDGARPITGKGDSWLFLAQVTGGAEAARAILRNQGLFSALVDPVKEIHQTTWRELASQDDSTLAIGATRLPWRDVSWIALEVNRELAPDALVLVTDERPEAYWYMLPLFSSLGLFGLLFAWALVRTVRSMREREAKAS